VKPRINVVWSCAAVAVALAAGAIVYAQGGRPLSPRGSASAQVSGTWTNVGKQTYVVGGGNYEGGKWIDITYGSPLKRGRDIFGSGANYGKGTLLGAPIWRAGADVSTQLETEVPLKIGTGTVPPGKYTLFVDLKANDWTFVVSRWPAQKTYDQNNKAELWGAYGYTPDKDVLRAKMKLEPQPHSHEQLKWEFVDMTKNGGAIALSWDKTMALVPFTVGG
jgi:Protein of unknown function (DUF2911)